jgi:hypothetical protein
MNLFLWTLCFLLQGNPAVGTRSLPGVKVSGRIANDAGASGHHYTVLLKGGLRSGLPELSQAVNPDGSFELPQVPPGSYTLAGTVTFDIDSSTSVFTEMTPSVPVNVASGDVSGVQLDIPKMKQVRIHTKIDGELGIPQVTVQLSNGQTHGVVILQPRENNDALLPVDGYRMQINPVRLPQAYVVKSMTYGAIDLLREPLKINDGSTTKIVLTLSRR